MSEQGKVFIIAGMHRSSTSLAASIVQNGGVHIGRTLLTGDYANAHGYFENEEFTKFHRAAFREQRLPQAGWVTSGEVPISPERAALARRLIAESLKQAGANNWGWKDPRTTLFLEFWRELLPSASFIFLYRSPWEVVDSIFRRAMEHDMYFQGDPQMLVDIWCHYNRKLLEFMERHPAQSLLVSSDAIVADPAGFIAKINERFGFSLKPPEKGVVDAKLINRGASSSDRPRLVAQASSEAIALLEKLNQLNSMKEHACGIPAADSSAPALDTHFLFRQWFDEVSASRLAVTVDDRSEPRRPDAEQAQAIMSCQWAMISAMETTLRRMLRSKSWRLTTLYRRLEWRLNPKKFDRSHLVEVPPAKTTVKNSGSKRAAFVLPGVFLPGTYQLRIKVAPDAPQSPIELRFSWGGGAKGPTFPCTIEADGGGACNLTLREPVPICNILIDSKMDSRSLLEFELKRIA